MLLWRGTVTLLAEYPSRLDYVSAPLGIPKYSARQVRAVVKQAGSDLRSNRTWLIPSELAWRHGWTQGSSMIRGRSALTVNQGIHLASHSSRWMTECEPGRWYFSDPGNNMTAKDNLTHNERIFRFASDSPWKTACRIWFLTWSTNSEFTKHSTDLRLENMPRQAEHHLWTWRSKVTTSLLHTF